MPTSPAPAITPNRVPGIYCPHRRTAVLFPRGTPVHSDAATHPFPPIAETPNAQVPLDKGKKQAMQILNGRAGLGPMSEAKAHALLLRAAHSLCAASAWLARTPAASRINGGGGPRGHSPPSPPCSCSCWCSRASATCYSPPRDQSGRECGLHHSWAPIRFSELAPRFAREGGVQRSPSHAGLACGSL